MLLQVIHPCKGFAAKVTLVWLLPGVNAAVLYQIVLLKKRFSTLVAAELLRPFMVLFVPTENMAIRK